jgi:TatD DNase family protein
MLSTKKGQELVGMLPRDKVLTETDGPFAEFKGNSLMPWDVGIAIDQLARVWNLDKVETRGIVLENFRKLVSMI